MIDAPPPGRKREPKSQFLVETNANHRMADALLPGGLAMAVNRRTEKPSSTVNHANGVNSTRTSPMVNILASLARQRRANDKLPSPRCLLCQIKAGFAFCHVTIINGTSDNHQHQHATCAPAPNPRQQRRSVSRRRNQAKIMTRGARWYKLPSTAAPMLEADGFGVKLPLK